MMDDSKTFDYMTLEEIRETVGKINTKTRALQTSSEYHPLSLVLCGDGEGAEYCAIKLDDTILWDSEVESRTWLDDNTQEPLLECLEWRLGEYLDSLQNMMEAIMQLRGKKKNND
jgi:hypothetical protein